jgi:hypothetical protein
VLAAVVSFHFAKTLLWGKGGEQVTVGREGTDGGARAVWQDFFEINRQISPRFFERNRLM